MKFTLALCFLPLFAQDTFRLPMTPFDFQDEAGALYSRISQLHTDGKLIYLASNQSTTFIAINQRGKIIHQFGGKGGGPTELGQTGVLALSVSGNRVWAIDMELKRVRMFQEGAYQSSFRLGSYNITYMSPSHNQFAHSATHVVVPADTRTAHSLAAVYNHKGELLQHVGEPIDFDLSPLIIGMNDTQWLTYKDGWISVHKFFPMVSVYDSSFSLVDQLQIDSPAYAELLDSTFKYEPKNGQHIMPQAIFTDAKIFRDDLFLMSNGQLHQVDLKTHKIKSITRFSGKGHDFKELSVDPIPYYFAILDSGLAILAHPAMMWNHDLWKVQLPFLQLQPN